MSYDSITNISSLILQVSIEMHVGSFTYEWLILGRNSDTVWKIKVETDSKTLK